MFAYPNCTISAVVDNCLTDWSWFEFFGGDLFTFSDVSRCPGTLLFFSSSLGRSFYFSGTAPFLKVHRLPPGTRNMSFVRKWTLQTPVQTTTFSPHGFPNFNDAFHPWKSRKPKACFFSLSNRTFYLSNQKNRALFLDFVSSCLPPSWNTIRLKPRFHSNRKSELSKVSVMHVNNMFPTVSGQLISLYTMSNNGFYSKLYFTMNSLEHR